MEGAARFLSAAERAIHMYDRYEMSANTRKRKKTSSDDVSLPCDMKQSICMRNWHNGVSKFKPLTTVCKPNNEPATASPRPIYNMLSLYRILWCSIVENLQREIADKGDVDRVGLPRAKDLGPEQGLRSVC